MRGPPAPEVRRAASAKAAPVPHFPAANLSSTNDSERRLGAQACKLRRRFALGYYFATALAPLIWGLPR